MKKIIDKIIFDAAVSDRKILLVPVSSIHHTPYNPPSRTKEGKALQNLMDTISRHGLVYPILISSDRDVIDGNRRLAACRALGMDSVECIVSAVDKNDLYSDVNGNTLKIVGAGWLHVARHGGTPPKKEAEMYRELNGLIGSYGIDTLIQHNIGIGILPFAKMVCALGTKKRLPDVIMAMGTRKLTNKVNAELRSDKTREEKAKAIDSLLETA